MHIGELMLKVASIFVTADDRILRHLERDSEWLQHQLGQYAPISHDFVTKFAYEMFPTSIALGKTIMVRILRRVSASNLLVSGCAAGFGRRTRYCRCGTGGHTSRSP